MYAPYILTAERRTWRCHNGVNPNTSSSIKARGSRLRKGCTSLPRLKLSKAARVKTKLDLTFSHLPLLQLIRDLSIFKVNFCQYNIVTKIYVNASHRNNATISDVHCTLWSGVHPCHYQKSRELNDYPRGKRSEEGRERKGNGYVLHFLFGFVFGLGRMHLRVNILARSNFLSLPMWCTFFTKFLSDWVDLTHLMNLGLKK